MTSHIETKIDCSDINQQAQNEALLANSELGKVLVAGYHAAVEIEPRLTSVAILPVNETEVVRTAFARPSWSNKNTTGKHEVHVRLDNLKDTLRFYGDTMQQLPVAIQIISERLGVNPEFATPKLMYFHSIFHEMGHAVEYLAFEADPAILQARQKAERLALPIGNTTASALIKPTLARAYVEQNWEAIQAGLGVTTMDELTNKQAHAYRDMTSEAFADNFGTAVFKATPQLHQEL